MSEYRFTEYFEHEVLRSAPTYVASGASRWLNGLCAASRRTITFNEDAMVLNGLASASARWRHSPSVR